MFLNNKKFQSYTSLKALLLSVSCLVFILLFSFKDYTSQALFGSDSLFIDHKTYTFQNNSLDNGFIVTGYVKDEKVEEAESENDDFHILNNTKLHRYTILLSDTLHNICYYNLSNSFKNQIALPLFILHQSWQGYLS